MSNYTVELLYIEDTTGTQLAVLYTVELLYIEDTTGTQLAVLYRKNSEVDLYTALCGWDCRQCPH